MMVQKQTGAENSEFASRMPLPEPSAKGAAAGHSLSYTITLPSDASLEKHFGKDAKNAHALAEETARLIPEVIRRIEAHLSSLGFTPDSHRPLEIRIVPEALQTKDGEKRVLGGSYDPAGNSIAIALGNRHAVPSEKSEGQLPAGANSVKGRELSSSPSLSSPDYVATVLAHELAHYYSIRNFGAESPFSKEGYDERLVEGINQWQVGRLMGFLAREDISPYDSLSKNYFTGGENEAYYGHAVFAAHLMLAFGFKRTISFIQSPEGFSEYASIPKQYGVHPDNIRAFWKSWASKHPDLVENAVKEDVSVLSSHSARGEGETIECAARLSRLKSLISTPEAKQFLKGRLLEDVEDAIKISKQN